MAKRKRKAKRRSKSRKRARKRVARRKTRGRPNLLFAVALVVLLAFVLAFSFPSGNNGSGSGTGDTGPTWQEQTTGTTPMGVPTEGMEGRYTCKSDIQCFVVSCKDTPEDTACVNALATETYGDDYCDGYWDFDVYHDYRNCKCVDGLCSR
jgi:hypothetical protein